MKLMKSKKGMFQDMSALATGIAGLAFILIITFLVIANTQDQVAETESNHSFSMNATREMQSNTYSIVGWIGLVIIVAIGVLILGLVRKIRQ